LLKNTNDAFILIQTSFAELQLVAIMGAELNTLLGNSPKHCHAAATQECYSRKNRDEPPQPAASM